MRPIPGPRYDGPNRPRRGVTVEYESHQQHDLEPSDAARIAADAMAEKKGLDIRLLDVGDLLSITEIFVIATGTSRPHVKTLAEFTEEKLREAGRRPLREEGRTEAEWVLLDFGDFVVHVFQPEQRDFYGLERLWSDAPLVDWRSDAEAV